MGQIAKKQLVIKCIIMVTVLTGELLFAATTLLEWLLATHVKLFDESQSSSFNQLYATM